MWKMRESKELKMPPSIGGMSFWVNEGKTKFENAVYELGLGGRLRIIFCHFKNMWVLRSWIKFEVEN